MKPGSFPSVTGIAQICKGDRSRRAVMVSMLGMGGLLQRLDPTSTERPPISSDRVYPQNTGSEWGKALARQLEPDDKTTRQLLGNAQRLLPLEATKTPPGDRFAPGDYSADDEALQNEVSKLIDQGVIGANAFVISDTGHDIPIMATLMSRIDMSGTVRLPDGFDVDPSRERYASQAQTWGNEIDRLDRKNANDGEVDSYFLGLEVHREQFIQFRQLRELISDTPEAQYMKPLSAAEKLGADDIWKIDTNTLPSAGRLKAAGVKKVVVLLEKAPGKLSIKHAMPDIQDYLANLRDSGLEVDLRGVDPRLRTVR
jgi:hypothetical protein